MSGDPAGSSSQMSHSAYSEIPSVPDGFFRAGNGAFCVCKALSAAVLIKINKNPRAQYSILFPGEAGLAPLNNLEAGHGSPSSLCLLAPPPATGIERQTTEWSAWSVITDGRILLSKSALLSVSVTAPVASARPSCLCSCLDRACFKNSISHQRPGEGLGFFPPALSSNLENLPEHAAFVLLAERRLHRRRFCLGSSWEGDYLVSCTSVLLSPILGERQEQDCASLFLPIFLGRSESGASVICHPSWTFFLLTVQAQWVCVELHRVSGPRHTDCMGPAFGFEDEHWGVGGAEALGKGTAFVCQEVLGQPVTSRCLERDCPCNSSCEMLGSSDAGVPPYLCVVVALPWILESGDKRKSYVKCRVLP